MAGAGECAQVTGSGQQHRPEDRPETGHRLDACGITMAAEQLGDLGIQGDDPLIKGQHGTASSVIPAAMSWPGSTTCWDLAAVTARAAESKSVS
ncbi:hypothetical protein [Nocardia abscessus]|uniref:hypothetical protein n=1 Tax=Nocardia abscessus TaxID=120957 RepID=UPI001D13F7DD|nr:hypothetical protein [Nocardia abscessus]MCC3332163.1 hypothetical protein [Nocardia abscessus]